MFWARDVVFEVVYIVLILVHLGFWGGVWSNFGVGLFGEFGLTRHGFWVWVRFDV